MNKISLYLLLALAFSPQNPIFAMEECMEIPCPDCREEVPPSLYCEYEMVLSGSDPVALHYNKEYEFFNSTFKDYYLKSKKTPHDVFEQSIKDLHSKVQKTMSKSLSDVQYEVSDYQQLLRATENLLKAVREARGS